MKNIGRQNQNGFSLIEMMLVCVIMGIVAFGFTEMFINQAKHQRNAQQKANALQVQIAIQSAASDPAAILRSSTQ